MKKAFLFILITVCFLGSAQPASAKFIYSTKASCSDEDNKMNGAVYFKGKLFSSKGKLKVKLTKVFYRLGPGTSSSDKNDIWLGKKRNDASYYKSPDALSRTGKWESKRIKKKVIVPFMTPLIFTINFDEFWDDPKCSESLNFNFSSLKGQKPR